MIKSLPALLLACFLGVAWTASEASAQEVIHLGNHVHIENQTFRTLTFTVHFIRYKDKAARKFTETRTVNHGQTATWDLGQDFIHYVVTDDADIRKPKRHSIMVEGVDQNGKRYTWGGTGPGQGLLYGVESSSFGGGGTRAHLKFVLNLN